MHSIGPVYIHAQSALAGSAKQSNEAHGSLYDYCNACRRAKKEAL